MSNFEEYLVSIGYERFWMPVRGVKEAKDLRLVRPRVSKNGKVQYGFSTMNVIRYEYYKDPSIIKTIDSGELPENRSNYAIIYGLHELGKGPTLIHPRPKIKITYVDKETKEIIGYEFYCSDDYINRILQNYSSEFIYDSLFNNYVYEFEEIVEKKN